MPPRTVVIGVDSSTQSTKAAVTDTETGELLAVGRAPHVVTGEGGARETNPEVWWLALCDAVAAGLKESGLSPSSVVGIAVAGQQHGLVTLDRAGRPLRPALLWNDTRSAPQAAALVAELGGPEAWTARTGTVPVASMTATKWRWLREYDPDLLERLGLSVSMLPEVAATGGTRIGSLTDSAAEALGLPAGIAVAAGTGDNMSAAVGLGLGGAGLLDHPVLSLGTSGTVFAASRARPASPALSGFAAADGTYLPLACTLNCTLAVDKVAALLGLDRNDAAPGGEAVLLPYLDGERTPDLPTAAGLLTGLRHDTTPRQLLGAAYEAP